MKILRFLELLAIATLFLSIGGIARGWHDTETKVGYFPEDPWYLQEQTTRSAENVPETVKEDVIRLTEMLNGYIRRYERHESNMLARVQRIEDLVMKEREARLTRLEATIENISFWLRTLSLGIVGLSLYIIQEVIRRGLARRNGNKKENWCEK